MTIPVLPNGETLMCEKLLRVANLIEGIMALHPEIPSGTVFLGASEYAVLMGELKAKLPRKTPTEFFEQPHFLVSAHVTVRNAGTDDKAVIAEANRQYAEKCGFEWHARELVTGRVDGA